MTRQSNYDKFPSVLVDRASDSCAVGWDEIARIVAVWCSSARSVVCVECYPGVCESEVLEELNRRLKPTLFVDTSKLLKPAAAMDGLVSGYLGGDPIFGRMNGLEINDFLDESVVLSTRQKIKSVREGVILVVGTGASLVAATWDVLVYADLGRWEIQKRQRKGEIGNLGADNASESSALKYKRAFFVDWRAADRLKKRLLGSIDFLLDTNDRSRPKLITGSAFHKGLRTAAARPFRVVPYFDPGPWGGHWMEEICDLPKGQPNYAWCFDCVPEENSLLLQFGEERVEIPAIDLVFSHPRELLGDAVHGRFGAEFPIRFDFLDTMGGGNLSLQVHPLTEYIQDKFGMNYTQDESYYLLEAGAAGKVYLGLKEGIDKDAMLRDLCRSLDGSTVFDAEKYVNQFPAQKHDHFLIPAGTVHCSGKDSMVLEISATPYIFTFKLWDWDRVGLNGLPRPIHIEHGAANIQWDRTTRWVQKNLVNQCAEVASGDGWREERTGLHEREFIETRRHWFTKRVPHDTQGTVNVLNLVQGEEAVVESPSNAFEPFRIHYAETFIIPAAAGKYTIRPFGTGSNRECATIKAFVRSNP
jgi:mannose-6-phosphate isomerase class I